MDRVATSDQTRAQMRDPIHNQTSGHEQSLDVSPNETSGRTSGIILFDGICHFCNGWVRFIIRHDPRAVFAFASLQSEWARQWVAERSLAADMPDSIILIEADRFYVQSTAVLRIARCLRAPWKWLYWLILIPRGWRDRVYRWVARHRHRIGRWPNACELPSKEVRARFLDHEGSPNTDAKG